MFFCVLSVRADDIWNIDARFCVDWKYTDDINMIVDDSRKQKVCIEFVNNLNYDVGINIWFVDASIANNVVENRACDVSSDFAKFVKSKYDNSLIISGNTSIKKYFDLEFPVEFDGFAYGCLVYNLSKQNINLNNQVFDILVRKANFMSFYVGETYIDNNIEFMNFWKKFEWEDLILWFDIKNNWNTSQTVYMTWYVSNVFWV